MNDATDVIKTYAYQYPCGHFGANAPSQIYTCEVCATIAQARAEALEEAVKAIEDNMRIAMSENGLLVFHRAIAAVKDLAKGVKND